MDNYRAKGKPGIYMPGKLLSKRCYPAHLHKPFGYRGKRKLDAEQADECQDEGVRQGHPHHAAIREANQWRECRGQQEQERSLTVRRSDGGQIGTVLMATASSSYCFNVIAPLSIAAFASLI